MKTQVTVLITAVIALVGCGSSKDKLSDEKISRLNDTLSAVGRIERAGAAARPGTRAARGEGRALASEGSSDDAQAQMAQRLGQNACSIEFQSPDAGSTSFNARFRVDGPRCPVVMDYRMAMDTDIFAGKLTYDVDASYKVSDSDYARLNDVDALNLKGGIKVNREDDKLVLSGSVNGTIHSQKTGKVDVTMTVSGEENKDGDGTATQTIEFRFPDFTAELKTVLQDRNQKYYLNDEEITEEAYKAYLTKAGTLFSVSAVSNQKR